MARSKRWRVLVLRREQVDSSCTVEVEAATKQEAERQALIYGRNTRRWTEDDRTLTTLKVEVDTMEVVRDTRVSK